MEKLRSFIYIKKRAPHSREMRLLVHLGAVSGCSFPPPAMNEVRELDETPKEIQLAHHNAQLIYCRINRF